MRPIRLSLALGLLLAACAAADGPPSVTLDRSACAYCGMLVSELRTAAAMRLRPGEPAQVFDDVGCLLNAWKEADDTSQAVAWAMDADGNWMPAPEATFVSGPIATPMGGGILAFRDRNAAVAYAAGVDGASIVSFEELARR